MRPLTGTDYDRLRHDGHLQRVWPRRHDRARERLALAVYVVVLPVAALLVLAVAIGGLVFLFRLLIRSLGGALFIP